MCAINPKHNKRYIIDVYTAHPTITEDEFLVCVMGQLLNAERELNKSDMFRFHLKESEQEAD